MSVFFQPILISASISESRRDVEELLLGCSFLPQRSLHTLLRRLRHQAICGRWAALFRPAWQLRRAVELVSPFSSIFVHPVPPSSSGLGDAAVLWIPPAHLTVTILCTRGLRSMIWTPPHQL